MTNLLTATLKFDGNITVQIQGDGPLRLALVNGNDQQQIRAVARVDGDITENMNLHNMIGKGVLVITIAPKEGERYQGVISLDKPTDHGMLRRLFCTLRTASNSINYSYWRI